MRGAITHVLAGIPVSDLDASIDWYTRFLGRWAAVARDPGEDAAVGDDDGDYLQGSPPP
jgi:hypothetical protein